MKIRLISLVCISLTKSLVDLWVRRPFPYDARLAEEGGQGLELVLSRRQFGVIQGRQYSHLCQLKTRKRVGIISFILKRFYQPFLKTNSTPSRLE